MADPSTPGTVLVPVHPLETRRATLAALSADLAPDLTIEIEPDVAVLDVRLGCQRSRAADTGRPQLDSVDRPAERGLRAAAAVLGAPLPAAVGTWRATPDGRAFRLGPDQWLVTSATADPGPWEASVIEALRPHGGTATDVSAQRAGIRLNGGRARGLLAHGCSLDLRPRAFPAGACAQTRFGQVGVLLAADGDTDTGSITILVRSTAAGHLVDRLVDAADGIRSDRPRCDRSRSDPPPRRELP